MTRTPPGTPVISLEGVRKYRENFDLGPVDLQIEPGQVLAVVGPNNSGKSTLFEMLMNLLTPSSGEIQIFGCSYPEDEVHIKRRIGYVPERSVGYHDMDAIELGDFASHWYPAWDQAYYMILLERLGDPREDFGELSKGMQRRISFALALATSPELLLLDGPTEGVDHLARELMLDEIWRFVESGTEEDGVSDGARTVVFATHNLEDVTDIADHVLLLADGQCLGPYEVDSLVDGWRAFYVNGGTGDLPGVVEVDGRNPARLISNAPRKTAEALIASNIPVIDESSVALEEILFHLVRRSIAGA